jgi:competence protein ComEA
MDATSQPPGPSAPPPAALPAAPVSPGLAVTTQPLDVIRAWPRCAQLAGAFVLGALAALLGVHSLTYWRGSAEPSTLETAPVSYRVDLNEARRAELLQLPGVGPGLADRILEYRRSSGGFRDVAELRKVQGVGPTTLERLRPLVFVRSAADDVVEVALVPNKAPAAPLNKAASLKEPIDVNTASLAELQKLPGIGPKMSQRIVDERDKHAFTTVNDLRRVPGIGPKTFDKIKPYVTVGVKM